MACSRLHHGNVLELYAVFEDVEAFYFVMQCVCPPAKRLPALTRLTWGGVSDMFLAVICFTSSSAAAGASLSGKPKAPSPLCPLR